MERSRPAEAPPVCAQCGRKPRDGENAADEWRAYRDIDDDLPVFCPECAKREFGAGGDPDKTLSPDTPGATPPTPAGERTSAGPS